MALNKHGIDHKAIARDQKAIDKLPNHGLWSGKSKSKALHKAKEEKGEYVAPHKIKKYPYLTGGYNK